MKTVDNFEIQVKQVIDALHSEEFTSIAVVARKEYGGLYISSSTPTPETLKLFEAAIGQINSGEFDER